MQTSPHEGTSKIHDLPKQYSSVPSIERSGRGHDSQESCGADRPRQPVTRVLQQNFCRPQKLRGLETSNRPKSSQQMDRTDQVQDGDTSEYPSGFKPRGMDDINRPKRCLFSHPDPSEVPSVSKICVGGPDSPIQGLVFWTLHGPSSLHPGDGHSGISVPSERHKIIQIPGRLANCVQVSRGSPSRYKLGSSTNSKARIVSEPPKIRPNPLPDPRLSGHGTEHLLGPGPTCSQTCGSTAGAGTTIQGDGQPVSLGLASANWSSRVIGKIGALGPNAPQISPIPLKVSLGSRDGSKEHHDSHLQSSYSRPHMVGRPRQSPGRDALEPTSSRHPVVYRCVQPGLGGPHVTSPGVRTMGPSGESTTYKLTGITSSKIRSTSFSGHMPEQNSTDNVGQLHSSLPHQKSGGDTIMEHVSENTGAAEMVLRKQHLPEVPLYPWPEKRLSGSAQQEEPGLTSRMVSSPKHMRHDLESVGSPASRLICNQMEPQVTNILLSSSRPSSMGHRLHDNAMGQPICLRLPSPSSSRSSDSKAAPVPKHQADPNSSTVATTALVCRDSVSSHRPSKKTARVEITAETTTLKQVPPVSRSVSVPRVDLIERGIRSRGFSEKAASRMARPNRNSTLSLYQAKWSQFCSWCRQGHTDPLKASIPLLADFFIYLREDKNLSCTAIKGYRSALSQVFLSRGLDISSSPEISLLFKNFEQELSGKVIAPPKWDLNLVLQSLLRPPYEPIATASLRNLTLKTVFLLSLASAKRVSEMHGLSYIVSWASDRSSATLSLTPDFIAKTQTPGDPKSAYGPIVIPALSSSVGHDDPEILLCPLRALEWYLKRTAAARPLCNRLFVSSAATFKHKAVSKNTISFCIRSVIKTAYNSVPKEDLQLWKISAHEVRALATSLLFKQNHSISQVMTAASWRSNSTFVSFYLRDLNHQYLDISSLGPVVAAQAIIPSTSTSTSDKDQSRKSKQKKKGEPPNRKSKQRHDRC